MVKKIINFRMLDGPKGLTSLALQSSNEEVLIVSQFTLAAITNKGNKPSFHKAAKPEDAKLMYDKFPELFQNHLIILESIFLLEFFLEQVSQNASLYEYISLN